MGGKDCSAAKYIHPALGRARAGCSQLQRFDALPLEVRDGFQQWERAALPGES